VISGRLKGVSRGMHRLAIALVLAIAACGQSVPVPAATAAATTAASAAATSAQTAAATSAGTAASTAGARPAFLTYAFTNVRDGSKFTLSDFSGKSVLVIGMAVW
jgi:hypothetical protein